MNIVELPTCYYISNWFAKILYNRFDKLYGGSVSQKPEADDCDDQTTDAVYPKLLPFGSRCISIHIVTPSFLTLQHQCIQRFDPIYTHVHVFVI